jgi:prevent-host-death family protein
VCRPAYSVSLFATPFSMLLGMRIQTSIRPEAFSNDGAYEAKTHLPRLLREVADGETITITRHGVPVALLVPPTPWQKPSSDDVIDAWREYRKTMQLGPGPSIREMIEEGRRF